MGILDEDVARVREATNMVAVVSEHVGLKRVGRRYQGLCPFHSEKTPSFSVNPELGLYHCFGCGVGGDAIRFIREVEHLDFATAVERLAVKAGITLRYDDAATTRDRQRRDRLVEATAAAVDFYHRLLLDDPGAGVARKYLRSRGIDGDVARAFSIGWSPDSYDALSVHLQRDKKFSRQDLVDAGLAFVNRVNKLQDFFRARVMFPIFDVRGDPVAFGGRALEGGPKYKNSPESPIYQKSRVLYGLNWAKPDIVARSEAVICEGYTDVIAFFGAGVPRAVATCGTALAEDHVRVLRNFAPNLVLAYDADDAGQNAALRIYQWEASYEIRLSVADLPPGQDPADVGLADPPRLAASVEGARPFLQFRLERLLRAADLASVEGRAAAAKSAVALIAEHPDDLVRDQYLMQLADRVAIDVDRLRRATADAREHYLPPPRQARRDRPDRRDGYSDRRPGEEAPPRRRPPVRDRTEVEALRVAVHEPALVADRLDGVLFVDPVVHEAYCLLAASATFHEALERAGGEVHDLLQRLAVEDLPWGDDPGTYATSVLVQLVEAAGTRRLADMVRSGDDRASELKAVLEMLVSNRSAGTWTVAAHAAEQLLPWVAGSGEE
ncbi:MAG TPA: DNA primase [Acidimicrobiia bacterium]|nr:DNA primase [Acidimicrobiia bacterium]